jgi:NAD(P)-dependent dehydrogenase (short-subunit alcohol dehydrogenase family)
MFEREIAPRGISPDELASVVPLGRLGTGPDIAASACFLLFDEAGWITGQTFHVNGGTVLV